MYGSGVGTGMIKTITVHLIKQTPKALILVPAVFCPVVVGAMMRRTAVWLTAASTTLATGTTTTGSG